tara:strand:- start:2029 stop:5805 length:3777 start_codon:yes stop_codon:yes gene_type:complete
MEQQNIDEEVKKLRDYEEQIKKQLEQADNLFVKKIQSAYRTKLTKDKEQMIIGDLLCSMNIKSSNLGKKDVYRKTINEKLIENNTPHLLTNILIFYCKFGLKSLGYDYNSKERYFIKEINNSMFVNVSFKSTNFKGIKFNLVKFINKDSYSDQLQSLMRRRYKSLAKNFKPSEKLIFDKADFTNCELNNCSFHNVYLKEITVGNGGASESLTARNEGFKHDTTCFNSAKFISSTLYFPFNWNIHNNTESANKSELITINRLLTVTNPKTYKNGTFDLKSQLVTSSYQPYLVFNKTKFIYTKFLRKDETFGQDKVNHLYKIRFDECEFKDATFSMLNFENVIFNKCSFEKCEINKTRFRDCAFIGCKFSKNRFSTCVFCDNGITEFSDCYFQDDVFLSCALSDTISDSITFTNTTIFRSNTKLNHVVFQKCQLILLKFNFDAIYKSDSNNILDMKNCSFYSNILYGTSFDYCNLEGSKLSATNLGLEKCNWLGQCFIKMPKKDTGTQKYILGKAIDTNILSNQFYIQILDAFIKNTDEEREQNYDHSNKLKHIYTWKYSELLRDNITADKFLNFNPWDWVESTQNNKKYRYAILPATSFYRANIRSCNFQQLNGFEGFDFTVVKRIEGTNTPDLNATNFTFVDLTNANFTGCNLIGTVFQIADIKGANFQNSITNEHTDFENTQNVELALNTENINFGELQNRANETHARADFVIKNRDKIIQFFSYYPLFDVDNSVDIYINQFDKIFNDLNNNKSITHVDKRYIENNFLPFILAVVVDKLEYRKNDNNYTNLKSNLLKCITPEFINILTSEQNPRQNDTNKNKWTWFSMVYTSILFIYTQSRIYTDSFFKYYFNEVFNAHGQGSMSCTKGMVERFVTIHSQTAEYFVMTLDIDNPTPEIAKQIQHYDETDPDKIDPYIGLAFIKSFKDNEKYEYHKLINILKPSSDLPESKENDLNIDFDYNVTPNMREQWHRSMKEKVNSGEIKTIKDVCNDFVQTIENMILKEAGITEGAINNIMKNSKKKELFFNKHYKLIEHLNKEELPKLKDAIIYMYGSEESDIGTEQLKDYFEDAGSRRKRKAKGFSRKAKSLPLNKPNRFTRISPRKAKTDSHIVYKSYQNFEGKLVKNFANLSNKKINEIYKNTVIQNISLKNMNITDKQYRNTIKTKFNQINDNYKSTVKNTNKYIESINLKSKKLSPMKIKKSRKSNTRKNTIKTKKNITRKSKSRKKSKTIRNLTTKSLTRKNNNSVIVNKLTQTI